MSHWTPATPAALLIAAILLWAPAASAEPPAVPFMRDGWYLTAAGQYSLQDISNFATPSSKVSDTFGATGHAGYRWLKYFGTDFQFEWNHDFENESGTDPAKGRKIETYYFGLNQRFYAPMDLLGNAFAHVQPWIGGGVGLLLTRRSGGSCLGCSRDNDGGFAGRAGGGIDVFITPQWALSADATYVMPVSGEIDDVYYTAISWGVTYRFDFDY